MDLRLSPSNVCDWSIWNEHEKFDWPTIQGAKCEVRINTSSNINRGKFLPVLLSFDMELSSSKDSSIEFAMSLLSSSSSISSSKESELVIFAQRITNSFGCSLPSSNKSQFSLTLKIFCADGVSHFAERSRSGDFSLSRLFHWISFNFSSKIYIIYYYSV